MLTDATKIIDCRLHHFITILNGIYNMNKNYAVAIDPAVRNTLPMEIVDACAITIRLYLVL